MTLPDDASSGATPHRLAQAASERRRSGLSPAATSRAARCQPRPRGGPTVRERPHGPAGPGAAGASELSVKGDNPPSQNPDRCGGGVQHQIPGSLPRTDSGCRAAEHGRRHTVEVFSQLIGPTELQVADLGQGLDPGGAGTAPSDQPPG